MQQQYRQHFENSLGDFFQSKPQCETVDVFEAGMAKYGSGIQFQVGQLNDPALVDELVEDFFNKMYNELPQPVLKVYRPHVELEMSQNSPIYRFYFWVK